MSAGRVLATQQARDAAKQLIALTVSMREQVGRVIQQGGVLADSQQWDGGLAGRWRNDWGLDANHLKQAAAKLNQLEHKAQQVVEDIFKADGAPASAAMGVMLTSNNSDQTSESDRRGRGDRREDRRVRNDNEIRRTPEGGRGRGGSFDSDWAGREILERYLDGGGQTWTINNDLQWNKYMMHNVKLANDLNGRVQGLALALYDQYSTTGQTSGKFNDTFHQAIENDEGIVGYQYLHGTNEDAGDFNMKGDVTITPTVDGYDVRIKSNYTWNDKIDPNMEYSTDRLKSQFAEIITLGGAESYDIHITWPAETVVRLDYNGRVISVEGYPGR